MGSLHWVEPTWDSLSPFAPPLPSLSCSLSQNKEKTKKQDGKKIVCNVGSVNNVSLYVACLFIFLLLVFGLMFFKKLMKIFYCLFS